MKQEEACSVGGALVVHLYSPSGTVPWTLATCHCSWIKPWKQSLQSKCWQGRSLEPSSCRSHRHNEQVGATASICPSLEMRFWSVSGCLIKLMPMSMPTPVPIPRTGAFPLTSSGVKQRAERASSTPVERARSIPLKGSTKHSDLFLFRGKSSGQLKEPSEHKVSKVLPGVEAHASASTLHLDLERVQDLCSGKQSLEPSATLCFLTRFIGLQKWSRTTCASPWYKF
jgi:hypothetical protein